MGEIDATFSRHISEVAIADDIPVDAENDY